MSPRPQLVFSVTGREGATAERCIYICGDISTGYFPTPAYFLCVHPLGLEIIGCAITIIPGRACAILRAIYEHTVQATAGAGGSGSGPQRGPNRTFWGPKRVAKTEPRSVDSPTAYYGEDIKYLVGPMVHTKTYIYITIFTDNIWSYLLWSPVIGRTYRSISSSKDVRSQHFHPLTQNKSCRAAAVHGSGLTSRVRSGRVDSGRVRVARPDPWEFENILTRPQRLNPARETPKISYPTRGSGRDP